MNQHARLSIASLALGVSLVLARPSLAQAQYTAVDLGRLPFSVVSQAYGVNDRGEAVGISGFPSNGAAWMREGLLAIGTALPSPSDSIAVDINKRGDVVGHSLSGTSAGRTWRAFLWRDGALTDLGTLPGHDSSYGAAINDRGEIAGNSFRWSSGPTHVVLWRDGAIHDLGALPDAQTFVTEINNRRQIVGYAIVGLTSRAFVWQDGVFTYLPSLSDVEYTFAEAINDRGEIVGSSRAADGAQRAVLWRDGTIVDLGLLPGTTSAAARGINDRGVIAGFASSPDGTTRAVVWERGQILELGTLPGGVDAAATAINNHGEIVGFGADVPGHSYRAIMWIPVKGGGK
jgi:probable HAF family extracellular repeat protein